MNAIKLTNEFFRSFAGQCAKRRRPKGRNLLVSSKFPRLFLSLSCLSASGNESFNYCRPRDHPKRITTKPIYYIAEISPNNEEEMNWSQWGGRIVRGVLYAIVSLVRITNEFKSELIFQHVGVTIQKFKIKGEILLEGVFNTTYLFS